MLDGRLRRGGKILIYNKPYILSGTGFLFTLFFLMKNTVLLIGNGENNERAKR